MKYKTLWCALLCCWQATLFAQKTTLSGWVRDTAGAGLPAASVVLTELKDSVIAAFGAAEPDGRFTIKRVPPGEYLLQVSYAGFETHYQTVSTNPDRPLIELGSIVLQPANVWLKGVEISAQHSPVAFSNDTIVYNTAAFKTQPGSMVEDLLKKLPGVEVLSDGTIRAQGEVVRNVKVDGKDFFGEDPKIATRNLPADAIEKVQLYDQKSERASFTGIEDGREEKTINLQLKPGAKAGYFGNASAGYGDKDRYETKFNLNRFAKKTQVSAIAAANNTNQQNFSFEDYMQFMGGLSNLMSAGGGTGGRVRISLDDNSLGMPVGDQPNGFTTALSGGLNLNHDFSKNTKVSAHYFYNHLQNDLNRKVARVNVLDEQGFRSSENEDRYSRNQNHRLQVTLRSNLDSFQKITLRTRWTFNDALLNSGSDRQTFLPEGANANNSLRDYQSDGQNYRGDAAFTYRRRFRKKGRALVADVSYLSGADDREGRLQSENYFFTDSTFRESFRQRQTYTDEAAHYGATLSYTEPLGRQQYLEIRAEHQLVNNDTDKAFYDQKGTPTPGEVFNPLLSNRFQRGYRYERGVMNWMRTRKKYQLTAGATLQQSVLDGRQPNTELEPLRRRFVRVLPHLYYNYERRSGRSFSAAYSTQLREPSLEQLLPVVDNSDPLQVFTGNPDLQPEYVHDLNLDYMLFDAFSNFLLFASLNTTYTHHRITNAGAIDSLFRSSMRPVNVDYDWLVNPYLNIAYPVRPLKSNLSLTLSGTYNRGILFVNEVRNQTDRWIQNIDVSLDNRKKDKIDLSVGARLTYNQTRYSVSKGLDQAFFNQRYTTDLRFYPNKKWALGTGLTYLVYSKETFGEARQIPLWSAQVTRYVLKNRKGQVRLSAFDLLNKNTGISRNSQFNYIEEVRMLNLSRYFMLSFAYALSGFETQQSGLQVRRIGG